MNKIIEADIFNIISAIPGIERFRQKTILISGANGFLPAYIVETLWCINLRFPDFGIKVIALVRSKQKAEKRFAHLLSDQFITLIQHDVCEPFETKDNIDFIIHAASQASPKYFKVDPVGTLNANILGTNNLIKLAYQKKIESFLFFSSAEVYGHVSNEDMPIAENTYGFLDPTIIRSCYAESKRMGENICISWLHQYGVNVKIVRPFHTYGPGMDLEDGRVFADFVSSVVYKKDIVLKSEGKSKRAFCYLADATVAFLIVLLYGESGKPYNIGNPREEYSIGELANVVVGIFPEFDLSVKFEMDHSSSVPNRGKSNPDRSLPDISRIKELGWSPETSAFDGFKRTILSFLD